MIDETTKYLLATQPCRRDPFEVEESGIEDNIAEQLPHLELEQVQVILTNP